MRTFFRRLTAWLTRSRLDTELAEEMRLHLELKRQSLIDAGMDPRDAAYEAQRQFGNVTAIREDSRAMWSYRWLDTVEQDLRYGARVLRRSPLFTAVALVSLAIGIGASSAVFGVADAILFRKLPVPSPDQLRVFRWISGPVFPCESLNGNSSGNANQNSSTSFSRATYEAIRAKVAANAEVFGFADLYRVNLSVNGLPETGYGQVVSGNYFAALGGRAAAGRLIVDGDDSAAAPPVAVLSHDFCVRKFGSAAGALGKTLIMNGVAFTVIGVTMPDFPSTLQVGQQPDLTVPLSIYKAVMPGDDPGDPNFWWVLLMARLKPGVRPDQVQSAADAILKQMVASAKPAIGPKDLPRIMVEPGAHGQTEERTGMREPIIAMTLIVGIVLLVACANVANLFLARGSARLRELTVRVAIGASRPRIIRQLLTEGLLVSAVASALGLALGQWVATALLGGIASSSSPFVVDTRLDWRLAGFTATVATICTLLFALVPALRATNVRLPSGLQENVRHQAGHRRSRLAGGLVIAQVALSMVLLTVAGLLTFSLRNLREVNPGFNPHNLLLFRIDPMLNGYDEERARQLYANTVEQLSAIPGVRAVTLSSHRLIANSASIGVAVPEGTSTPSPASAGAQSFVNEHLAWRNIVGDRFFETMQIPLVRGRSFGPTEGQQSPRVAVINRTLARQLFKSEDVVGRRFLMGLSPGQQRAIEIVGVSADAKYDSMRHNARPTAYLSYRQSAASAPTFAIRFSTDNAAVVRAVRETMQRIEPAVPLYDLRTEDEQIRLSLQSEQLFATVAGTLGLLVLLLSAVGLYGLMAYSVTRRTPEIGVRMALGAGRGAVRWMVLGQSLRLVVLGLVFGVAAALAGTRVIKSMLYGLTATDPATIAAAAVLMTLVCLVAAFVPARRASRVDPMIALRLE